MSEQADGVGLVQSAAERRTTAPGDLQAGTAVVQSVAAKLLTPLLAAHRISNVAFSPLSITLAIGMLRTGAQGASATELDALFGVDGTIVHAALDAVGRQVADLDDGDSPLRQGVDFGVHLSLANALWGQRGITWREPFLAALAAEYGTGMRTVDYASDPEACRLLINAWVEAQTHGKIPELLVCGSFTDEHVLTLTNALWFKARWRYPFDLTASGPFTTPGGSDVDVQRMAVSSEVLANGSGSGWQSVHVPYVGGHLAMVLLLPDRGTEDAVERALSTATGMHELLRPSGERTVELTMPLFDLDTATELVDVLATIGVSSPFVEETSDFDPMTADARVWVDRIAHQATVAVDQYGTEAAAATAVLMRRTSARLPVDPITIVVDRPFYFAITTVDDGLPLFLGRVTDPTAT